MLLGQSLIVINNHCIFRRAVVTILLYRYTTQTRIQWNHDMHRIVDKSIRDNSCCIAIHFDSKCHCFGMWILFHCSAKLRPKIGHIIMIRQKSPTCYDSIVRNQEFFQPLAFIVIQALVIFACRQKLVPSIDIVIL